MNVRGVILWPLRLLKRLGWRRLLASFVATVFVCVVAFWTAAHLVPLPERLDYGDSLVVTYEDGRPAHALLSDDDQWRFPTRIDDVDPAYIDALIALEDKRFYSHPGVDPVAVVRASRDNLRSGATVSGASTITMQLVRLLEPRPRTLRSKAVEAFRAMQLEMHMSKEEILEAYLRFAPFGGNIEGIEAATLSYWDRTPTGMNAAEIATLLAIPQSPNARRPSPDNAERLREARDDIAYRLASAGAIPLSERPDELTRLLEETEVPTRVGRPPREIPHVVHWLKRHRPEAFERDEAGRGEPSIRIETTLDRSVQRRISDVVADHERRLRATGAPHAAVVVLESETGEVRGVVGNLGFDITVPGSHLPAFVAPRSTGSLLKPVAYAAALDEGLVAPSHMLLDVPIVRGDYRPQNFDRQYRVLVEAEEALAMSLNLPFVRLVERIGVDEFVQALARFYFLGPVYRAGDGGLELVIGGLPASALEVAALYAGYARGGLPVMPEIFAVDDGVETPPAADREPISVDEERRAVSSAAAWLTNRALTRRHAPWYDVGTRFTREEAIVWKTGTSFAYHDAWTAGFGNEYTVAVWAGDLSFERHPELIGATVAGPLFFDVMHAIDDPYPLRRARQDDELAHIEVCSRSGRRPGPHCPHTRTTEAPARTAAPERCDLHVEIDVDAASGHRLPSGCRPDGVERVEQRVVERLPDAAARFERARGRRAGTMPDIHPDCRVEDEATLAITSPREESRVVLEPTRPADRQLVRLEAYSSVGSRIHWYVGGRHIDSAPAGEPVYWVPEPGRWSITAVDERGMRTSRELVVDGEALEEE